MLALGDTSDSEDLHMPVDYSDDTPMLSGDFAIFKVPGKKAFYYFVEEIVSLIVNDKPEEIAYKVKYLKRIPTFIFTEKEEQIALLEDVLLKLPRPAVTGGTLRTLETVKFPIDLAQYDRILK